MRRGWGEVRRPELLKTGNLLDDFANLEEKDWEESQLMNGRNNIEVAGLQINNPTFSYSGNPPTSPTCGTAVGVPHFNFSSEILIKSLFIYCISSTPKKGLIRREEEPKNEQVEIVWAILTEGAVNRQKQLAILLPTSSGHGWDPAHWITEFLTWLVYHQTSVEMFLQYRSKAGYWPYSFWMCTKVEYSQMRNNFAACLPVFLNCHVMDQQRVKSWFRTDYTLRAISKHQSEFKLSDFEV